MKPDRQFLLAHPAHFIALGMGAGLARHAPGTWGTLVAFPLFWLASLIPLTGAMGVLVLFLFMVGVWAAARTGQDCGIADHGSIVIDEIAAFFLVLIFTPPRWSWYGVAFLLFRLFDIWKPWPIRYFDRSLKGGFGVMFDDLLAAVFSIAALFLLRHLIEGAVS